MQVPLNDLSRTSPSDVALVSQTITQIIETGQYFNGPETRKFTKAISARLDNQEFQPLANGTDALILAIESLQLPAGSNIALAPNAGGYGTVATIRAGHNPVFIDVDLATAQLSFSALQNAMRTKKIHAVILTHLYGLVANILEIADFCALQGVYLIEDCAQAFGAKVGGSSVGTFGDIGTFSFYPTKNLGAFGDAGGITTKSSIQMDNIRSLAQYGWRNRYDIQLERGFNSRMDEIQAAVLNHNLLNLDSENVRRRSIIQAYQSRLDGSRRMIFSDDESFVGHLAVLISPNRDSDYKSLTTDGVECGIHYPTLDYCQIAWRGSYGGTENAECVNAELLSKSILTLPCFPNMTQEELEHVHNALNGLGKK
jgi:dTDP-4-amino-4,6-dideoxygalactose transaminase